MSVLKVTCITSNQSYGDPRIEAIGGDGFYHTVDEAVGYINGRDHQYWTELSGESVWITVAYHQSGVGYLTTENNGSSPDSLLSLNECQLQLQETSSSIEADATAMAARVGDPDQFPLAEAAERLALRTIVRLLVLNRYGRDDARLNRNREDAILRACGAIDRMEIPQESKEQLQEAVTRELEIFFAPPIQR